MNQSSSDDIENWISPEMWSDPWRQFTTTFERRQDETSSTSFLSTTRSEMETGTKFAESDFDITDSAPLGSNQAGHESNNPNVSTVSSEDSEIGIKDQKPI